MSSMLTDRLVRSAREYERSFVQTVFGGRPVSAVAVITCMDARVQPEAILGLVSGDAHVLRNAGGRVTDDMIRSLILSSYELGTRHVMVIHHSDCGLSHATQDGIVSSVRGASGARVGGIDFRTIRDYPQAIRADVERLQQCGLLLNGMQISGWFYDVSTGHLEPTEPVRTVSR